MATIVTRAAKGSALTFTEVDDNFTNLNTEGTANSSAITALQNDKFDKAGGTVTGAATFSSTLTTSAKVATSSENNLQSGSLITVSAPGAEIVRFTNSALVSVAGIQSGLSGQRLILVNRTGVSVQIENESVSALAANQIYTGTGGTITLNANASLTLTYDAVASRWNIIGGTGSGTGSSGINYISNPDASIGTAGYVAYNDGSAVPIDGAGGAPPSGLWIRSTTSPLRGSGDFNLVKTGAISYQGSGVACDFTIDNADLAKVLTITADYEVVSGTFATGDLGIYIIQDPTGTPVVIQPAGYQLQAATVGTKMKLIATFQTDSVVKSYRLCFHVATTSTQDYTLAFDTISVGPQVVQYGAPITGSVAYTPTITGFGTVTNVAFYSKRVGDSLEVEGYFTAGTPTATQAQITLGFGGQNANVVADVSRVRPGSIIGQAGQSGAASTYFGMCVLSPATNQNYINLGAQTSTGAELTAVNGSFVVAAANISVKFKVPIVGWDSTVVMSNDTDTRVVAAAAFGNANLGVVSGAAIPYTSTVYDTHGAMTIASGRFTAPVPGFYTVGLAAFARQTGTGNSVLLYKNGSIFQAIVSFGVAGVSYSGTCTIYLNAQEYIDLRVDGAFTLLQGFTTFINRLSGPSAIAASETVAARYTIAAQVASSTTQPINYATRVYDSHGAVQTGASWRFIAPISGLYQVIGSGASATSSTAFYIYKNGTQAVDIGSQSSSFGLSQIGTISLVAGDYIDLRYGSSLNTTATTTQNWIAINRIGNYV